MSSIDPAPAQPELADDAAAVKPAAKFVQPIIAVPDRKFFIKRMLIGCAVLGFAGFFLYDGFKRYPDHNAMRSVLVAELNATKDETLHDAKQKELRDFGNAKSDFDLLLQKIIGFTMLPIALCLLAKFLRESKGTLRLENDVLHAPGHPPVPIASITDVENGRWEKKGIALFDYTLADGTTGEIRIDDFIFDRPPTDAIHDELLLKMPRTVVT